MLEQYLLSYNAANLFSAMVYFIPVFFSILAGLGAFGWSGMEKGSKEWKQKRIRVAVAVVIDILAIVVAFNGRWTKQDIDAWKEYTYLKNQKNKALGGLFPREAFQKLSHESSDSF